MVYSEDLYRRFNKLGAENVKLKTQLYDMREHNHTLNKRIGQLKEAADKLKSNYDAKLAEKDETIQALTVELARAKAVCAHDGTNTGIPTSQTPISKNKVIPNSRRGSGKKRGGQFGHAKNTLGAFDEAEVNERVTHELEENHICGSCGSKDFIATGERIFKDETDVEIKVIKRHHEYLKYRCSGCGMEIHAPIENRLKEANQYGSTIQSLALSLMDTGNVPINKVVTIVSGITDGQINLSEGFVAKLQRRASNGLNAFMHDLRIEMLTRGILYWDDTVVMINKTKGCLRFYGDETIAFYAAHPHKDMEGINKDNVLHLLDKNTYVMHDHNKVNYNDKFIFRNIECNQHLQRDLQKNTDDTGHEWSDELKSLISRTLKDRKDAIAAGNTSFSSMYIQEFDDDLSGILCKAVKEYQSTPQLRRQQFEETLRTRICQYRENYFLWVRDFTIPTTNNLSERGLRCIKSHQKISGQFESAETAGFYARIKSYIETCRRNGINEIEALLRLGNGKPYSVAEIFAKPDG